MSSYKEIIICINYFAVNFIMNDYIVDYLNKESEVEIANLCSTLKNE